MLVLWFCGPNEACESSLGSFPQQEFLLVSSSLCHCISVKEETHTQTHTNTHTHTLTHDGSTMWASVKMLVPMHLDLATFSAIHFGGLIMFVQIPGGSRVCWVTW